VIEERAFYGLPTRLDTCLRDTYTLSLVLAGEKATVLDSMHAQSLRNSFLTESWMPNHKSAEKRVRQNEKRRDNNRSNRSRLRTSIKKLRAALAGSPSTQEAATLLPATISTIDKAVQKGVLHRNAAARYKSRLTTRVNQATAAK
jgi:small subunit ribosomal protein S20